MKHRKIKKKQALTEQIREIIRSHELTQYQIGKDTGINHSQLSKFMLGKAGMSLTMLDRLCEFLELEINVREK